MIQDNVVKLIQPAEFSDPLTEVLREGARALLAQAVEAEVAAFLSGHADRQTEDGRQRLVRHGHRPERAIMTGLGPVPVRAPRVRDRTGAGESRIRFTSAILPPYARRSKSLEVLIPILYLKGISSGDFEDALSALLGPDAGGLSASSIARLKEAWSGEHARWSKRDLSAKRYVYFWVDGIHVQARLEADAQCLLVIIGATPEGKKELVGFTDGVRESAQSWRDLLLDLRRRGLSTARACVADGALGSGRPEEVWPKTRGQRCWVHKTANVLDKLPKSQQPKAKRALQEIWMAETKKDALVAFDAFVETYRVKYDKAAIFPPSTGSTYGPARPSSRSGFPHVSAPQAASTGARSLPMPSCTAIWPMLSPSSASRLISSALARVAIGSYRGLTAPADWRLPRMFLGKGGGTLAAAKRLPSLNQLCYTARPSRWALTGSNNAALTCGAGMMT